MEYFSWDYWFFGGVTLPIKKSQCYFSLISFLKLNENWGKYIVFQGNENNMNSEWITKYQRRIFFHISSKRIIFFKKVSEHHIHCFLIQWCNDSLISFNISFWLWEVHHHCAYTITSADLFKSMYDLEDCVYL